MDLRKNGRILYISSVDISIGNGPGVNELEFILALHRLIGDRVHFLIPRPAEKVADLPEDLCTFTFPHNGHKLWRYLVHIMSQIRFAKRLLATCRFDLLLFRLDVMPFMPLYITKKFDIPYALKNLGPGPQHVLYDKGGILGRLLGPINSVLTKQLVKSALVADTVSKMQQRYLEKAHHTKQNKIVSVANSVNTERFYPVPTKVARETLDIEELNPIIGYVGNLPWERGGSQIVETIPALLSKYPKIGAVVLGDGSGLNALRRRAHELKIGDRCIFTGYVHYHKVPLYVNALDVGVSILEPKCYAACEQKVRQYLACGKPVIATPGSNDFLATLNLGSIIKPYDIGAMAREIDRWLSLTKEEHMEFANRAIQYAREHLSVQHAVAKRIALWDDRLRMERP